MLSRRTSCKTGLVPIDGRVLKPAARYNHNVAMLTMSASGRVPGKSRSKTTTHMLHRCVLSTVMMQVSQSSWVVRTAAHGGDSIGSLNWWFPRWFSFGFSLLASSLHRLIVFHHLLLHPHHTCPPSIPLLTHLYSYSYSTSRFLAQARATCSSPVLSMSSARLTINALYMISPSSSSLSARSHLDTMQISVIQTLPNSLSSFMTSDCLLIDFRTSISSIPLALSASASLVHINLSSYSNPPSPYFTLCVCIWIFRAVQCVGRVSSMMLKEGEFGRLVGFVR